MRRRLASVPSVPAAAAAVLAALLVLWAGPAPAEQVYLKPEAFLDETFAQDPPPASTLWLTGNLRVAAQQVLQREPPPRLRYWQRGARIAWILEEIGKEEPITTGIVIEDGTLRRVQVLIYRETRGWEVRLPAFTRQFEGARLQPNGELDRRIDNISGATLSVNALKRLSRLALRLSQHLSE